MTKSSKKTLIVLLTAPLFLFGCASIERSTLLGAGIVGALGTGIGLAVNNSASSALLGGGIGITVGAGLGYLGHKDKEERLTLLKAAGKKNSPKDDYPTLRPPEASCSRVGEKIEGNRYIGPHIMCDIERPAVWSK